MKLTKSRQHRHYPFKLFLFCLLVTFKLFPGGAAAQNPRSPEKVFENQMDEQGGNQTQDDEKEGVDEASLNPDVIQELTIKQNLIPGLRLENPQNSLKAVFPDMDAFYTTRIAPIERGGTTFIGLVGYLMGEAIHREYEGLRSEKILYHPTQNKNPIGVAMGTRMDVKGSKEVLEVFAFYNNDGTIRDVKINHLPNKVANALAGGGYLKQFIGAHTADLENRRLRKGKRQVGALAKNARHPASGSEERRYFEAILRALKFNAAFMDVAHFITKYPAQMAYRDNQSMPAGLNVYREPQSGPEAYIRSIDRPSFRTGSRP